MPGRPALRTRRLLLSTGRLPDAVTSGLQSAIEALYGLERHRSDFRVEDTARVLAALGDPQLRFRAVHVAGTNGKGSVCALVERVLRASGVRTGLTTSPHLVDYRERIRISGRWLEANELEQRLEQVRGLEEAQGRTFFEITTALAFDAFARHDVEWGVVEVGLGGRLDATNVLVPEVCAITSVALDHTEILGGALWRIAREKAGILKPGVSVVAGVLPPEARGAARAIAEERRAPWFDAAQLVQFRDVRTHAGGAAFRAGCSPWGDLDLTMELRGGHQVDNARVALALLSLLADDRDVTLPASAIREGFAAARWPGRLEPCPDESRLWWDGAHNLEGVERLTAAWRRDLGLPPPDALVFASSRHKPVGVMLERLRQFAPEAELFVARAGNERARSAEELWVAADLAGWRARVCSDVAAAVSEALAAVPGRVLLAGSLFAVADAMRSFGGAPGPES
jgi:dihydrofolate synthase / folylpolyglutamate synthase